MAVRIRIEPENSQQVPFYIFRVGKISKEAKAVHFEGNYSNFAILKFVRMVLGK